MAFCEEANFKKLMKTLIPQFLFLVREFFSVTNKLINQNEHTVGLKTQLLHIRAQTQADRSVPVLPLYVQCDLMPHSHCFTL